MNPHTPSKRISFLIADVRRAIKSKGRMNGQGPRKRKNYNKVDMSRGVKSSKNSHKKCFQKYQKVGFLRKNLQFFTFNDILKKNI